MNKICTYLDLLGFSNYMNSNFEDAMLLIENYANILQMGFNISDNEFSSFNEFLPFSDSIFILSDDANSFIQEISHFLINCFLFTAHEYSFPIDKEKPTKVTIKEVGFNIEKKDIEVKEIERNWYPTIFKGGISYGDVETFSQRGLHNKLFFDQRNLAGKGIVSSVAMEKMGRGPRVFTDSSFISLLDEQNRTKYIIGRNNISEILWPIGIFIEDNPILSELENNYEKLMNPAINLWKAYEKTAVGEIYFNLMKIITLSAQRFAESKNEKQLFIDYLKQYLNKNKILHFFDSLIDITSFI